MATEVGSTSKPNNDFYGERFEKAAKQIDATGIGGFQELQIRSDLQIIRDVLYGSVQYEHIHPLLRRIDAMKDDFAKVVSVSSEPTDSETITVISLRDCKQDVKKILPLLIAKHFYERHKATVSSPPIQPCML